MKYAYVVTWNGPMQGREMKAIEYGVEVQEYWGQLAADGKCSEPEMFFFPDGHGMWMVKGDFQTLEQLWYSEQAQHLLAKGTWLLQDFGFEFVRTGDSADEYLMFFADVGKELALS